MIKKLLATALLGTALSTAAHASSARPVVLELFTSQGCSSCPPADALLVELAKDPTLLPLSFHVDYWDRLGWPDAFSSADNTERQQRYSTWMGRNNVFTPQMVIEGTVSVNGASRHAVAQAIAQARPKATDLSVMVRTQDDGNAVFTVAPAPSGSAATLVAIHYVPLATTKVERGENGGRALTSANNVTKIEKLGAWQNDAKEYPVARRAGEGVAVLLQHDADGTILSAANLPAD